MKKVFFVIAAALVLAMSSISAEASSFLNIDVSGTSVTCDNSTAGGVTTCTANGFATSLNSNTIIWTGTLNGVSFTSISLTGNSPGTPALAQVLDSKFNVQNISGAERVVTVDFGQNNFSQPLPVGTLLSASQTVNWTTATVDEDTQTFRAWGRDDNALTPGPTGATAVAIAPDCIAESAQTDACSEESPDVAFNYAVPFSLTGQQVITIQDGTTATYTGTAVAQPTPVIPEPSSVLLLGTGMLLLAGHRLRNRKKS